MAPSATITFDCNRLRNSAARVYVMGSAVIMKLHKKPEFQRKQAQEKNLLIVPRRTSFSERNWVWWAASLLRRIITELPSPLRRRNAGVVACALAKGKMCIISYRNTHNANKYCDRRQAHAGYASCHRYKDQA